MCIPIQHTEMNMHTLIDNEGKREEGQIRGRQQKDDKRQEEIREMKTKQDREREASQLSMIH